MADDYQGVYVALRQKPQRDLSGIVVTARQNSGISIGLFKGFDHENVGDDISM